VQDVHAVLPIGTLIGDRYNVVGLLGKGGFGAVYLARDQRVRGNLFALKEMIDTSKQERARFAFESELLKRLDHPGLPRVYRSFEDETSNRSYMLMDFIEGPNLETLRQKQPQKRFPLSQVMGMMAPIFEAVSYLHRQRPPIIHRDIKPANIIVPSAGDQTVLVDFGIAKEFDPDSTTTAVRRCSPGYGAPEQYNRGTNTRTDIYGLGATIYALLTGVVPDDAFYRMTNIGSGNGDPLEPANQLNPDIPAHVSDAIQRAMSINIEDRFPTADQFWRALNAQPAQPMTPVPPMVTPLPAVYDAQDGHEPVTPAPVVPVAAHNVLSSLTTQPQKVTERTRRRGIWPLLLLALIVLALVSGLAAAFWPSITGHQGTQPTTPTPVVQHKVTPAATSAPKPKPTPKPTQTSAPAATPTAAPAVTPTPIPSSYPSVAGTHYGSVHNSTANINATMSVSLNQNQGNLGGNVTINSPLQGSGSITSGFVQKNNYIQFTVQGFNGHAPLQFYGTVQQGGSMSGQYCSIDQTGRCNAASGGQGTWSVGAIASPSGSSYIKDLFPPPSRLSLTVASS
jgi:eukaryotic-like serine/threonine-protein kinase